MKKNEQELVILEEGILAASKIDREGMCIKDVLILSRYSRSADGSVRREYPPQVLRESVSVFDGAPAYIQHNTAKAQTGRDLTEQYGVYRNVRALSDRVIGDLHLLDCDDARFVLSLAEKSPESAGNSIHAGGKIRPGGTPELVECSPQAWG